MSKRLKHIILLLLILLFCLGNLANAEVGDSGEDFRQGLLCYGEINFTCALDYFKMAEQKEKATDPQSEKLVDIYKYMAFSQIALGMDQQAEDSFKNACMIREDFMLSKDKVSPKVYSIFEDAKKETEVIRLKKKQAELEAKQIEREKDLKLKKEQESEAEVKQEAKAKPLKWLVGFSASGTPLFGNPTDDFNFGFSLALDFGYRIHEYFTVGADISYQRHGSTKVTSGALNIMGIALEPAFVFEKPEYIVKVPLALGVATYGYGNIKNTQGMLVKIEPAIYYRVHPSVAVGAFVGPGGVILLHRSASSWFLNFGLSVLGTF